MLTNIKCPKDKQRLFNVNIKEKDPISLEPLSNFIKEIEIKCPKCGGIVSIDLKSKDLKVTMKVQGNTKVKRFDNRRRMHTEQRSQ